jgi:hypothetical protein
MQTHTHLSDRDLVLALDGELPPWRQAAIDAHLVECASCRTRQTGMGDAACVAVRPCRPAGYLEGHDRSRERLRAALVDMTRLGKAPAGGRFASTFSRAPHWAMIGAALFLLALFGRIASSEFHAIGTAALVEEDALPIASLTPGATWNVTVQELCSPVAREQRPISAAVRHQVLRGYRMEQVAADEYELDYLITPELGGAPDVQNLWPQRYASRNWNAYVKDQLERHLPKLVCNGTVPLQTAQRDIAVDWIAAYKKYFRTELPLQERAHTQPSGAAPVSDDDLVYPVWRSETAPALVLVSFAASR